MSGGAQLLASLDAQLKGVRGKITPNAEMAKLTWLAVGGLADALFEPEDEDDLAGFLKTLPIGVPVMVLGAGSNLLVREGGIRGFVVKPGARFGAAERVGDTQIRAGAACPDRTVAALALEAGIGGFHFYHGIPGTIGGALRMNAGANGLETADRLVEARALDRQGNLHVLSNAEMGYGYRSSAAPVDLIFTSALLEGFAQDSAEIKAQTDAVQHHRETVQPIREKTGGSTFKNPDGGSAWEEIDAAGCRGLMIGGAQMSPLHCNFMINTGTATGYDLEYLGETVRQRVMENSGVRLQWEMRRVGAFYPGREVQEFLGQML